MKKLLLPLLTIISGIAFGQGTPCPNYQQFGSGTTRTAILGLAQGQKGVTVGRYADTATANSSGCADYYPGTLIVTDNPVDELWQRNFNATKWINRGSFNLTTINFITDSSVIFCFGNGVCDTITTINFATTINNIVQNFIDSSIFLDNDSTLIICFEVGSCDTISLGNSNTFNIFFDTTLNSFILVTCDTVQIVCPTGPESCFQQQVCDTILIPRPPTTFYQNLLWKNGPIVEAGDPIFGQQAQAVHDTYFNLGGYQLTMQGAATLRPPLHIIQQQWSWLSSSIMSLNSLGPQWTGLGLQDSANNVNLYFNYISPFTVPTQGALAGNTVGFMGDRIGYALMVNSKGGQTGYAVDNVLSKQGGVFIHTRDTDNIDGVTIFSQQVPSAYPFHNNPPTDSTFLSKRVAVFKTDQDIQFPNYPNTRNDGTAGVAFFPLDTDGNVGVGAVAGGSTITIINDTTITICSFGDYLCDTFITEQAFQHVHILNDSMLLVCDTLGICDTLNIPQTGFDRGFFDPNQISTGNTDHYTSGYNFSVTNGGTVSPTGTNNNFLFGVGSDILANATKNFVALTDNTVSGSENVVFGRNMVVAGNTNFVAATDGQMFSTSNYSALFGDATINRGISSLTGGFGNKNWAESGFTMGTNNVNGSLNPTVGTANLYSNSSVLGINNFSIGNTNFVAGSDLTANHATGFITQFGKAFTVTTPNSFNVGYTTNAFEITANKVRINEARFEEYKGTTTAAAGDLTLPNNGNLFTISGATTTNAIATANWQAGSTIGFIFTGAPLLKHNTAGGAGTATMLLAGSEDFQAAAGDNIEFRYDGTNWHEIGRTIAATGSGPTVTADNALRKNTATNVQWGGPLATPGTLLFDTYITTSTFDISISGSKSGSDGILKVYNSVSGGTAIYGEGTTGVSAIGVKGLSSAGRGVYGESTTGVGVIGVTQTGVGVNAQTTNGGLALEIFPFTNASETSVHTAARIRRGTNGTAGVGFGSEFLFDANSATIADRNQVSLFTTWTNATDATRTAQFWIAAANSPTLNNIATFHGSGVVGIGITTGYTATRLEVVDNAATTQSISKFSSTSLSSGSVLDISINSTAATSNTQKGINILTTGANTNSTESTYGAYIVNSHTTNNSFNYGVYSKATGGVLFNVGFYGETQDATGYAFYGLATAGGGGKGIGINSLDHAIESISTNGLAAQLVSQPTSTNTVITVVEINRGSTGGAGADGIGGSIDFKNYTTTSAYQVSNQIISKWTTATNASTVSSLVLTGKLAAATVDLLTLAGDGSVKLRPITATAASAITPAEGMLVFVSDTDATFTTVGIWCYQNGAWKAL